MATKSNVRISVSTTGDVVLDEVWNCAENPKSPAIISLQTIPPDVFTQILNPFLGLDPEFQVTGVLVIPPANSTVPYTITTNPTHPNIGFHPTNPSFFSILGLESQQLYISHPTPNLNLTFRFIWV